MSPYPAAWTELHRDCGETLVIKVFETEQFIQPHSLSPGTILTDGKSYLKVAATDGFVSLRSLQLPGKKRLETAELLRGFRLTGENSFQ